MIKFRCPHRPWQTSNPKGESYKPRDAKAAARTSTYEVPADAEWERIDDSGAIDKPRYAHEVGARWQVEVVCPDCGDTICVSTDQDPSQPTTFDAEQEQAATTEPASEA